MSLRVRLSLIISVLFFCSMLLGVSFLISSARQRIADEVASTATLTYELLKVVLISDNGPLQASSQQHLLEQLKTLDTARHLDISINTSTNSTALLPALPSTATVPAWFNQLVHSAPLEFRLPLSSKGSDYLLILTNPAFETAEVWLDTRLFLALLLLVLLLLNGTLYFIIGRWLEPVNRIVKTLEGIEKGNNSKVSLSNALPELSIIAGKINHLSDALKSSRDENDRLASRSLQIQEEERRHLAQELHDDMGQSISAIKAIAFSIAQRNVRDAMTQEGARRIGSISNHVRDHVRSMMQRLRPGIVDELGLIPALQHMVDDWNRDHTPVFCSLKVKGSFSHLNNQQQIHVYRIVQEALTNVARHAQAENVDITLFEDDQCQLHIHDNGKGFSDHKITTGMGLRGIAERARALGGDSQIHTMPDQGVTIAVLFPGASQSSTESQ